MKVFPSKGIRRHRKEQTLMLHSMMVALINPVQYI